MGAGRNAVGIATRYRLEGQGIEARWGASLSAHFQSGPGVHPTSNIMGNGWVSYPGVKRLGRGVNHPPHRASRLKKEYSYTSTPLWAFVARSRVNFTFFIFTLATGDILNEKQLLLSASHYTFRYIICFPGTLAPVSFVSCSWTWATAFFTY